MATAERVSREANERIGRLTDEAYGLAGRIGEWVAERSQQLAEAAPDAKTVRAEAEGMLRTVGNWLSDLPDTLEKAMPVRVERRTRWSVVIVAAAAGAGVAYLFDAESGAARRERLKATITGMIQPDQQQGSNPPGDGGNGSTNPSLSNPGFERQPV